MDRNKKILIAIITLIVIILLSLGAYFYFSKKTVPTTQPSVTFPGGSGPATVSVGSGEVTPTQEPTFVPGSSAPLPRLYELHKLPVAGVGLAETGSTVSARYLERGLGHIYETPLATLIESRIVNETRSRIMEALWGNGGKSVVIRFIDEREGPAVIKTSVLNLGGTGTSFAQSTSTSNFIKTEEVFLPDYIPFMATTEDRSDKLFYLESGVGASVGSTATFKNTSVSTVFSSAFTEWLPQFPNQQLVTLTTKPSATVLGHLFFIDTKTKSVTKILGNINGLTTLTSHNGKSVLFSETKDGVPELSVYDIAKKSTRTLSLQTLPEKCTWSSKNIALVYCAVPQTIPSATYPDQWYQGLVAFSDAVWEIDITTGVTKKIMTPSEYGAPSLDIINPTLSSSDTYLLFMNKVTGTPWVYRLNTEITPIQTISTIPTTQPASTVPLMPRANPTPSVVAPDMQKIK